MFTAAQKSPEAFRTISEVAEELDVPQHVLRFWETKFVAVKPLKRGGGRRYYRPDDIDLLRGIRSLLYSDGLTIKGAQKVLRQRGVRYVTELGRASVSHMETVGTIAIVDAVPAEEAKVPESNIRHFPPQGALGLGGAQRAQLSHLLEELTELKSRLAQSRQAQSQGPRGG
ncbi:MAG: hypothetical protein RJB62_1443 [Pseudomonadota bacterium]|jgi:DNA-binding transcriptional MerR regulator